MKNKQNTRPTPDLEPVRRALLKALARVPHEYFNLKGGHTTTCPACHIQQALAHLTTLAGEGGDDAKG